MLAMLAHVAAAARESALGPVSLVTSEPEADRLAGELGVGRIDDAGLAWNDGLALAVSQVPGGDGVLFLAADLPRVTAAEIRALAEAAEDPGVAVGRAHDGGTNALVIRPAGAIATAFGAPGSAAVHEQRARAAGLPAAIVDLPGLALDVDTPDDARTAGLEP